MSEVTTQETVKSRSASISAAKFMAALVMGERLNQTAAEVAAGLGMKLNSFTTRLAGERAAYNAEVEAAVKGGADKDTLPKFPKLKDGRSGREGTSTRPNMLQLLRAANPEVPAQE